MPPESLKELEVLLEKIRRLRKSFYGEGYDLDRWREIEQELSRIIGIKV
jgi:hypothetical protein